MKPKTVRDSNIEILRIVLMLMIVVHHLMVHGTALKEIGLNTYKPDQETPYYFLVNSFLIISVNCFIFITGYYGITFKMKTIIGLLVQALFYSLTITFCFYFFSDQHVSALDLLSSLFPVTTGFWWFLTTYLFLFLLSPLLNVCTSFTEKQFRYIIIVFTLLNCIAGFIFAPFSLGTEKGYSIIGFSYIYLLARYIRLYPNYFKLIENKALIIYVTCSLVVFAAAFTALRYVREDQAWRVFSYNNPLIVLSSVAFFFSFKRISLRNNAINTIAQCVFGVYLIHDHKFVREKLEYITHHFFNSNNSYITLTSIFTLALIIFVTCILIEKLRQIMFRSLLDWINKMTVWERFDKIWSA